LLAAQLGGQPLARGLAVLGLSTRLLRGASW